jgi:hypothetical protein
MAFCFLPKPGDAGPLHTQGWHRPDEHGFTSGPFGTHACDGQPHSTASGTGRLELQFRHFGKQNRVVNRNRLLFFQ